MPVWRLLFSPMVKKASALQPALRTVPVFVAYSDCTSASRALAALTAQWQRRGQRVALRPMLWRFEQLLEPRWREVAAHDALRAECVLLAIDRAEALDVQLERWIDALRDRAGSATLSLIVSVHNEDMWAMTMTGPEKSAALVGVSPSPLEVTGSVVARRLVATAA